MEKGRHIVALLITLLTVGQAGFSMELIMPEGAAKKNGAGRPEHTKKVKEGPVMILKGKAREEFVRMATRRRLLKEEITVMKRILTEKRGEAMPPPK